MISYTERKWAGEKVILLTIKVEEFAGLRDLGCFFV